MNSTSTPRFRFRDHKQEMADEESSEGHTTADSSFPSTDDGNDDPQLQSMTAKGVQHLCSELLELKQESDEDFQKNIFSNYSAFLAIMKDIEVLQTELLGLKKQASLQKRLVKDVSDKIYSNLLSEETIESMLQEILVLETSSPTLLETHTENVSEILDTLLSEHRLDDALAVLEMEGEYVQDLLSDDYSSSQLNSYNSTISQKRAMLADQLTLVAKHPRVSAPELQKALIGLCHLRDSHLANQLMLQYYHSRIASSIYNLQSSSRESPNVLYIQQVAKCVSSMISQAVRSFIALNGETYPYPSELTQWTTREMEVVAACFIKYVESISDMSGRLSTAVDALKIVMSYCSLLETQRIYLQHSLMEFIRPRVEGVLQLHVNHLSNVISMVTLAETWVLDRYYLSGILTGTSNVKGVSQQTECFFLTNSGRKFVTLFQSITEEIAPLITFQMESAVLKGIMDLFTAYVVILESAITGEDTEKEGFKNNLPETPTQGVFILANLSTLMQFSFGVIRNLFDGIHQLDFEIDSYETLVQDIYSRIKSCFLDHLISDIFSPNADHESSPEIRLSRQDSYTYADLIPSVPYLELYLELKKLEKLAEDDCIDINWLKNLFREVMDATFEWITSKSEIWTIRENLVANRTKFMQFILDTQFLVEIARRGEFLSDNAINISKDILFRVESCFLSAGLSPLRDSSYEEWPAKMAIVALHKLQQLHANESLENEDAADEYGVDLKLVIKNASDRVIDTNIQVSTTQDRPID